MGFFKDKSDSIQNAMNAAQNAPQAQANAEAQAAALNAGMTPDSFDPNDPGFAPIEGITLEEYVRLAKLVTTAGIQTAEEVDPFMVTQGLPAGGWKTISDGWNARMSTNRAVLNRYGILYSAL